MDSESETMIRHFNRKAVWILGVGLLLLTGCQTSRPDGRHRYAEENRMDVSTTHYLSGEVVSIDRAKALLGIREAVELDQRKIKELRLTSSTTVVKEGAPGSIEEIRRGDYVMVKYSIERNGTSDIDEVQLVSKPDSDSP
jgi:hypothetical protein